MFNLSESKYGLHIVIIIIFLLLSLFTVMPVLNMKDHFNFNIPGDNSGNHSIDTIVHIRILGNSSFCEYVFRFP